MFPRLVKSLLSPSPAQRKSLPTPSQNLTEQTQTLTANMRLLNNVSQPLVTTHDKTFPLQVPAQPPLVPVFISLVAVTVGFFLTVLGMSFHRKLVKITKELALNKSKHLSAQQKHTEQLAAKDTELFDLQMQISFKTQELHGHKLTVSGLKSELEKANTWCQDLQNAYENLGARLVSRDKSIQGLLSHGAKTAKDFQARIVEVGKEKEKLVCRVDELEAENAKVIARVVELEAEKSKLVSQVKEDKARFATQLAELHLEKFQLSKRFSSLEARKDILFSLTRRLGKIYDEQKEEIANLREDIKDKEDEVEALEIERQKVEIQVAEVKLENEVLAEELEDMVNMCENLQGWMSYMQKCEVDFDENGDDSHVQWIDDRTQCDADDGVEWIEDVNKGLGVAEVKWVWEEDEDLEVVEWTEAEDEMWPEAEYENEAEYGFEDENEGEYGYEDEAEDEAWRENSGNGETPTEADGEGKIGLEEEDGEVETHDSSDVMWPGTGEALAW
ncbi:hypothetical protein BDW02DRAFT_583381 [Decorospora gaudefroyi]|uniref:Uncharacterized protein n=1 Tax=Decorospora gaudefroyi TaxID=184978 RepID=A0A6A5K0T5_9PLEO|nr:hypothetical protein BDW02DRAFT_583381 [Decorospora gaudefroyi]